MLINEKKYSSYALVKEMLETGSVVQSLNISQIQTLAKKVTAKRILLTGEGSSRIFPAKNAIYSALKNGYQQVFFTEAATQALEYPLSDTATFVASNSGKTAEGVRLIHHLKKQNHSQIFGVIANDNTPIQTESNDHYLLTCGKEDAVAATKSVIEQALFYDILFRTQNNQPLPDLAELGDKITEVLETTIPEEVIAPLVEAQMLYFAGRNTGVAEELTLKTNEITRKKSDFLEGTYAVHGIEEVMSANEAVILVSPFAHEADKFSDVLIKGVGLPIVAISSEKTAFPTYQIPDCGDFTTYLELAAGWNLLVEIGIRTNIDLDKPERARKVGNEYING